MDNQLKSGESVSYRGQPGWCTAAIAIASGLSFAAAIHVIVGVLDDNWTCPASLMWLALMTPFGAILLARTAGCGLLITDRRILYRRSRSAPVEQVALADIRGATLGFDGVLPAMKISREDAEDMVVQHIAHLEELCHRVHRPKNAPEAAPQTFRGAVIIVLAAFGGSFGLFMGLFATYFLLSLDPTGSVETLRAWRESAEFPSRILGTAAVSLVAFVLIGPSLAAATLGAWLGYLPALLASRLLISFAEARHLALVPRRMAALVDLSQESEVSKEEQPGWIFMIVAVWTAMWGVFAINMIAPLNDRLTTLLFKRIATLDHGAALGTGGN